MPSSSNVGARYVAGRHAVVPCLFSLSLSCGLLVLIIIFCLRSFATLYIFNGSLPTPFSVTNLPVSEPLLSRYNGLKDSLPLQLLRLPDKVKLIYRENDSAVDEQHTAEGAGGISTVVNRKHVINILYTNVEQSHSPAEIDVCLRSRGCRSRSAGIAQEQRSTWPLEENSPVSSVPRVSQNESIERKILRTHVVEKKSKDEEAVTTKGGAAKISLTELLNWKGELEGVDLREPLQDLTSGERKEWLKLNWVNFQILQTSSVSEQFSQRLKAFFEGLDHAVKQGDEEQKAEGSGMELSDTWDKPKKGSDKCKLRFFMTWIASLASFGPREHICLESVFTTHPTACVVLLSTSLDTVDGRKVLQPFLDRGMRIMAAAPDLPFLFKGTPAADWFTMLKKGGQDPGDISFSQNLSNILRVTVLYKYGGIYLDSDVLLLKDFSGLANVIGAQSVDGASGKWSRLNNAVMIFDKNSPVLFKFIQEFALTYNGSKWGHNGPYLVTRVIRRLTGRPGYNFSIASPAAFYPENWARIKSFFQTPKTTEDRRWQLAKLEQLERGSYAVHLWNKGSRGLDVQEGSIIAKLFQQVCLFCDGRLRSRV